MLKQVTVKIKNWSVIIKTTNPYQTPELGIQCLMGQVYGHPRFEDGTEVTTSSIAGVEGDLIVTKSGMKYKLDMVNPEYERLYPNAKDRLLQSLRGNNMLKQVTVPIIVDDHEPEKCGNMCTYLDDRDGDGYWCNIFHVLLKYERRCKQCLEESK